MFLYKCKDGLAAILCEFVVLTFTTLRANSADNILVIFLLFFFGEAVLTSAHNLCF